MNKASGYLHLLPSLPTAVDGGWGEALNKDSGYLHLLESGYLHFLSSLPTAVDPAQLS